MGSVVDVVDAGQLAKLVAGKGLVVVHFWADWAKPCAALNKVLDELAKKHQAACFGRVEAEQCPELAEQHKITVVPTFLFWKGGASLAQQRIEGAKTAELTQAVAKLAAGGQVPAAGAAGAGPAAVVAGEDSKARLLRLVNHAPVMLFMKGSPAAPQCGFSRQAVEVLQATGARFSSFNILEHPEVRTGLKELFNWPTFPQLYVSGQLVGGLDVMRELAEDGSLKAMIPAEAFAPAPAAAAGGAADLAALVRRSPVMLFLKGSPQQPSCGFSNSMVQLLREQGVVFDSFDILADAGVREGLKVYSNWPTFPQLYVEGKLVGGLDIAREMAEDGSLLAAIPETNKVKK
jgi:Grx4 family monothiol glutaredoxin